MTLRDTDMGNLPRTTLILLVGLFAAVIGWLIIRQARKARTRRSFYGDLSVAYLRMWMAARNRPPT